MQTLASLAVLAGPGLSFDMSDPGFSLRREGELTHGDHERLRRAHEKRERKAARMLAQEKKARR